MKNDVAVIRKKLMFFLLVFIVLNSFFFIENSYDRFELFLCFISERVVLV